MNKTVTAAVTILAAAALAFSAAPVFAAEPGMVSFQEDIGDGLRSLTVSDYTKDYLAGVYEHGTAAPVPISGLTTESPRTDIYGAAADIRDDMARVLGNYHRTLKMGHADVFCADPQVCPEHGVIEDDRYLLLTEGEFIYDTEPEPDKHGHTLLNGFSSEWTSFSRPDDERGIAIVMSCPDQRWFADYIEAVKAVRGVVHDEMGITENDTKEDALAKINGWFCDNWNYDKDATHCTILEAITERRGSCSQISLIYEIAADYCGIDCSHVASAAMNHDWLSVSLGGETYYYDPTYAVTAYRETGDASYRTAWNHLTRNEISKDHTF